MPRRSAVSLDVVPLDVRRRRLVPPAGLSDAVRAIFVELVSATGPGHFVRSDVPLLVAYCSAIVAERQAAEAIAREGPVLAGRVSPWITVQEKQTRALVALSMRLRLAPQSRMDSRAAGRTADRSGVGAAYLDWRKASDEE